MYFRNPRSWGEYLGRTRNRVKNTNNISAKIVSDYIMEGMSISEVAAELNIEAKELVEYTTRNYDGIRRLLRGRKLSDGITIKPGWKNLLASK
jgi:hypothetical protein